MDTKRFILENDIMNKMRAALEQIAVGQGFTVFEGLETGTCNIGILYDGTNISFHKLERLKPEEIKILDEPVVVTGSEGETVEQEQQPPPDGSMPDSARVPAKRKRTQREHDFGEEQP